MRENFTILKQRAALERPTFPINPFLEPCLAAILDCRMIHGILWVLQETFLNDNLLEEDEPLLSSTIERMWHPLLKNWDLRFLEVQSNWTETWDENLRISQYLYHASKRRWIVKSYWWNFFSQWYDWLYEISYLGKASETISWLYGISKLESELQDWSMFEISRSSSHNTLDQRSWDSKVNWRTYDIAIDSGAKRFPRLRHACCDDCVCTEETSRQAHSLPQKSECRRAACSKIRPILTNSLHDPRAFPCNWSWWSNTRTLRFVQYTFAEWRCPRFRRSTGSSSIISKRDAFRCDPGRIVQVKITGLCSVSDFLFFVRPRNCSKLWSDKFFTTEYVCKISSYWSDDGNSKLQSPEKSCGERNSHQESKKGIREETGTLCAVVRDEEDDRPPPHQIRRPRLTAREKILEKSGNRDESSSDRKSEIPCRHKNCKNPSCNFWHSPVRQNYTSETGCKFW